MTWPPTWCEHLNISLQTTISEIEPCVIFRSWRRGASGTFGASCARCIAAGPTTARTSSTARCPSSAWPCPPPQSSTASASAAPSLSSPKQCTLTSDCCWPSSKRTATARGWTDTACSRASLTTATPLSPPCSNTSASSAPPSSWAIRACTSPRPACKPACPFAVENQLTHEPRYVQVDALEDSSGLYVGTLSQTITAGKHRDGHTLFKIAPHASLLGLELIAVTQIEPPAADDHFWTTEPTSSVSTPLTTFFCLVCQDAGTAKHKVGVAVVRSAQFTWTIKRHAVA